MIDTNRLMQELDIQDVIEKYTGSIFKHGKVNCPFHADKTPSLSVKNGRFRCWGCGAHGSAVDFVRKMYGDSFHEAVQRLADDFDLDIPDLLTDRNRQQTARPDLWDEVRLRSEAERVAEITAEIERLARESGRLADVHRKMYQAGCDVLADLVAQQIERIDNEIDFLMMVRR